MIACGDCASYQALSTTRMAATSIAFRYFEIRLAT